MELSSEIDRESSCSSLSGISEAARLEEYGSVGGRERRRGRGTVGRGRSRRRTGRGGGRDGGRAGSRGATGRGRSRSRDQSRAAQTFKESDEQRKERVTGLIEQLSETQAKEILCVVVARQSGIVVTPLTV